MNKLFTKIATGFVGIAMAVGVGVAIGSRNNVSITEALDTTYTFTSKAWADETNSWISDKACTGNADTRGQAVLAADSGAGAHTRSSFSSITEIKLNCSKSSKGVGSIVVKVGSTTVLTRSSFSTTATEYSSGALSNLSGAISFTVTCTTSTIYVKSITITHVPATPTVVIGFKKTNVEIGTPKSLGALSCSNFVGNSTIWTSSNTNAVTVSAVDNLTLSSGKYNGTTTPTISAAANASVGDIATINVYDGNDTSKTTSLGSFTVYVGKYYSYVFTQKVYSEDGTQTLSANGYNPDWTLSGGKYFDYTDAGQQFGSNGNPANNSTLSTSSFSDYIKTVIVNTSGGSSVVGTIAVSIGGVNLGSAQSFSSSPAEYTFTAASSLSGTIQLLWNMTTAKGTFIKSIELIMEDAPNVPVTSLSLGNDVVMHLGNADHTIHPTFNGGESIPTNQVVHYVSNDTNVVTVGATSGVIHIEGAGTTTITGTADDDSYNAADTISITVTAKVPSSLTRTKLIPQFVGQTFNQLAEIAGSKFVITYSDATTSDLTVYTSIVLYLDNVSNPSSISDLSSDNIISKDYVFSLNDNGKYIHYVYSEVVENVTYYAIRTDHFAGSSSIEEKIAFGDFTKSFTDSRQYLLTTDTSANSTLSVTYTQSSHASGTPTANAVSSNTNALTIASTSIDTSNKVVTMQLNPVALGNSEIEVTITLGSDTFTAYSGSINVRTSEPVQGNHYEKVTDTSGIVDGQYLFVFEDQAVAFNGNLDSGHVDANENTIAVTPVNDQIAVSNETTAAEFTVNVTDGTVMSTANGYYIYSDSYNNELDRTDTVATAKDYPMAMSIDENGNALFVSSSNTTLSYNNASNAQRFRFGKTPSTTGTSYRYLQLYILAGGEPTAEDLAFEFVDTYMKFDTVPVGEKGTGLCTSAGWFSAAKAAFLNATSEQDKNFHLTAEARLLVCSSSFQDTYDRLRAWASANTEEVVAIIEDAEVVDYTIRAKGSVGLFFRNTESTNSAIVITIATVTSLAALGGYFFIRKKKEI